MRQIVALLLAAASLAACNRDKAADVPVQQPADTTPVTNVAPAAGTNAAPAPGTSTSAASARPVPARPAPASPEALAAAELASASRVRTVQVGAFPGASEATWWAAELQKQGIPAYTTTARVDGAEVTRLRIGAALTVAEARAVADRIHERYKWPVWVTTVDDKAVLPPNALLATRNYIR